MVKTTGERIRLIRTSDKVNLTEEQFAEKLGIDINTVTQLENGTKEITDSLLKAISREFSTNPYWVSTGNGEMFIFLSE